MERPDFTQCKRSEARVYAEHLEGVIEDLTERLERVVGNPGAGAPKARASDPSTSRQASFDAYPKVGSRRWTCLQTIARAGQRGMTQSEVIATTNIQGAWKRLSELDEGGWIQPDGVERKGSAGSMQRVYVITEKGQEAIRKDQASETRQASTKTRVPDHIPHNLFAKTSED
jgi:hypothetical protein